RQGQFSQKKVVLGHPAFSLKHRDSHRFLPVIHSIKAAGTADRYNSIPFNDGSVMAGLPENPIVGGNLYPQTERTDIGENHFMKFCFSLFDSSNQGGASGNGLVRINPGKGVAAKKFPAEAADHRTFGGTANQENPADFRYG